MPFSSIPAASGPLGPPLRVVGLGASAGGLEPLMQFLAGVPSGSGMAYLVVQHLDPTHKALLCELLQRATTMPVHEAHNRQRIDADTVYVIPPNTEMTVRRGALHLAAPSRPRGLRLPIDALFLSMALECGAHAIGIVLSGMGADGREGLQAIKARGGLTLAQDPASAQFTLMPEAAIQAGCVDIIALPGEMAGRILQATGGLAPPPPQPPEPTPPDDGAAALRAILGLLRERTRHDLAQYKPSTLLRRIGRRMAVHGLPTMAAYVDFLRQNPQEIDLMFKEMLIGVTSFFRDPEVWQQLKDAVLPVLLARPGGAPAPLRAWVVGCSTGEEAYSLAMAFTEVAESMPEVPARELLIFATDLSADAIAVARAGRYPATIARDLTPQRLAKFFTERPGGYQIDKRLRDKVLFAQHDVILDAPFTRLDFLTCRNLLIYFDAALQGRLVPLFHYSLRPGGALMLGKSETVGRTPARFLPLDPMSRLYWRSERDDDIDTAHFPTRRRSLSPPAAQEIELTHPHDLPVNLQAQADQLLLQTCSPPAVLVNEAGDLVYISGRTGAYLEPAAGKANWNIHVMLRPGLRAQLAVALRTALHERTTVELRGLRIDDTSTARVDVTVQAILRPAALAGMAMIIFRDQAAVPVRRARRSKAGAAADAVVDKELLRAREEIRSLREEMHASKEELQAAIEELQSTNEELQSANEELTTTKEEAQSMNEELQTINGELQSKLDDLALAQSDMQNLLNSTDIATLFLDKDLNVRRFTEQMARVIHVREGDIGRPLVELASTLIYPELHADVQKTLRTLAFSEKQIATTDGQWFSVRIMPYRTLANVIQGVVITFVDITVAKELESRLRKA